MPIFSERLEFFNEGELYENAGYGDEEFNMRGRREEILTQSRRICDSALISYPGNFYFGPTIKKILFYN